VLSRDFIDDHELWIFDSRVGGRPGSAPHPIAPIRTRGHSTKHRQSKDGIVNVAAWDEKVAHPQTPRPIGSRENNPAKDVGRRKNTARGKAVATPTSEPNVAR